MQGGDFLSGAAGGFFGSLGADAWGGALKGMGYEKFANSAVGTVAFGALSGGIGAELSGGNFWQGAVTGGIVAGLNHAMHRGENINHQKNGEDPPTNSVGQPGEWESLIPVWGSGRAAVDHFQNGNYWTSAGYIALAVSDVFLIKSITTGIAKGGLIALTKNYNSWSSWRSFYGKTGYAKSGQHLHHWALRRNGATSGIGFGWNIKNQMWNLMPMKSPAFHTAIHGKGANAFNLFERFYHGTPNWVKSGTFSTIGHGVHYNSK